MGRRKKRKVKLSTSTLTFNYVLCISIAYNVLFLYHLSFHNVHIIIFVDSQKKKEDHDLFVDDEWKSFTLIVPLNLGFIVPVNLGFSVCIFIGMLILFKDKFNKLKCGTKISKKKFKRNRAIFKPRHGKLPSRSEIDLKRMQSYKYMSASDDNDYDSVMSDRESVCK